MSTFLSIPPGIAALGRAPGRRASPEPAEIRPALPAMLCPRERLSLVHKVTGWFVRAATPINSGSRLPIRQIGRAWFAIFTVQCLSWVALELRRELPQCAFGLGFYRGLEIPVHPISGIPNPHPSIDGPLGPEVPRSLGRGILHAKTPGDHNIPSGWIQAEGIKQLSNLLCLEGQKAGENSEVGGCVK